MNKVAVLTSKGGTGKTTTAINLGHGLALSGERVLLIDCDPQGSASAAFGVKSDRGLVDLMIDGRADIFKVRPNLYLLPSGRKRLADLEINLAAREDRERILKEALSRLSGCEWVILDCSPSINIINLNALGYADRLLVPSSLDYFSLEGVKSTLELAGDINNAHISNYIKESLQDIDIAIVAQIVDTALSITESIIRLIVSLSAKE